MPQIQQLPPAPCRPHRRRRGGGASRLRVQGASGKRASTPVPPPSPRELERGGLTYIRITDNGCGIAPEQLPTAFLRHATSKLRRPEDLAAIGTLGFRGEALAAIAAVSPGGHLLPHRPAQTAGAMLHLEGGVPASVSRGRLPRGHHHLRSGICFTTPPPG